MVFTAVKHNILKYYILEFNHKLIVMKQKPITNNSQLIIIFFSE